MAKKKKSEVAYVPLNTAAQVSNLIEQKVEQIPAYEDSGVKYQGKFKTQQSQNTFELRAQVTRFTTFGVQNTGGTFDFTFARPRSDLKFFCTKMIVHFRNMSTFGIINYIELSDYNGTTYSPRFYFFPTEASGTLVIDFSDSPRRFEGTFFAIRLLASLGVSEFIAFNLFGWEEQQ
jgi:hypothetical protein